MFRLALGITAAVVLVLAGIAAAGPADVDTSFGSSGYATIGGGVTGLGRDSAGRVVVVNNGSLTRLTPTGATDPSFNGGTPVALSGFIGPPAVVIQADDKIVVAGDASSGGGAVAVRRYNPNGSADTAYGTNTSLGASITFAGAALAPDGKVVVAGTDTTNNKAFAVRYTTSGTLDTTFAAGTGNIARLVTNSDARAVTVDSTGRPVIAGVAGANLFVGRQKTDGTVDTSFATSGFTVIAGAAGTSVGTDTSNRVIVGGSKGTQSLVARFTGNTAPEVQTPFAFGSADSSAAVKRLAVRPDGAVFTAGLVGDQIALARLTPDLALDARFGGRSAPPGTKLVASGATGPTFGGLAVAGDAAVLVAYQFGVAAVSGRVARVGTPNQAPVIANYIADDTATRGQTKGFSATATDPDFDDAEPTLSWTFGDGASASGGSVTHTYAKTGTYTVTVTATDGYGATSTKSSTITVTPAGGPAIAISFSAPTRGRIVSAAPAGFTATATGGEGPLTLDWDFGENRTWDEADLADPARQDFVPGATGGSVEHTYAPVIVAGLGQLYPPLADPPLDPKTEAIGVEPGVNGLTPPVAASGQSEVRRTVLVRVRATDGATGATRVVGAPLVVHADQPPDPHPNAFCASKGCTKGQPGRLEYKGASAFYSTSVDPDNSLQKSDPGGRDEIIRESWDFHDTSPIITRKPPCPDAKAPSYEFCAGINAITHDYFAARLGNAKPLDQQSFSGDDEATRLKLDNAAKALGATGPDHSGPRIVTLKVVDRSGRSRSLTRTFDMRKRIKPTPVLTFADAKVTGTKAEFETPIVKGGKEVVDLSQSIPDPDGTIAYTVLRIGTPDPPPCRPDKEKCKKADLPGGLGQTQATYVIKGAPAAVPIVFPFAGKSLSVLATAYDETGAQSSVRYDGFKVVDTAQKCQDVSGKIAGSSFLVNCGNYVKGSTELLSTQKPVSLNGVLFRPRGDGWIVVQICGSTKRLVASASEASGSCSTFTGNDDPLDVVVADNAVAGAGRAALKALVADKKVTIGTLPEARYKGFPLEPDLNIVLSGDDATTDFYGKMPDQFAAPDGKTTAHAVVKTHFEADPILVGPFDGWTPRSTKRRRVIAHTSADATPGLTPGDEASMGDFPLGGKTFQYDKKTDTFTLDIKTNEVPGLGIPVGDPKDPPIAIHIVLKNGSLKEATGSVGGLKIPVASAIQLTGFAFTMKAAGGSSLSLSGTVNFVDLPTQGVTLTGSGTVAATLPTPFSFSISGKGTVAQLVPVDASVGYTGGSVNFSAGASADFGPASFSTRFAGAFGNGGFQLTGDGKACLFACLRVKGLLSERAVAACGSLDLFLYTLQAGFGFTFKSADLDVFAGSCDLSSYKSAVVSRRRVFGQLTYDVPTRPVTDALAVVVGTSGFLAYVTGTPFRFGQVPQVELRAPDGRLIAQSTTTLGAFSRTGNLDPAKDTDHVLVEQDPVGGTVRFIVPKPVAALGQNYKVVVRNGSPPIFEPRWGYSDPPVSTKLFTERKVVNLTKEEEAALASGKDQLIGAQKGAESQAKPIPTSSRRASKTTPTGVVPSGALKETPVPAKGVTQPSDDQDAATVPVVYEPATAPDKPIVAADVYQPPATLSTYTIHSALKLKVHGTLPPGQKISFYEEGPATNQFLGTIQASDDGTFDDLNKIKFSPNGPDDGYNLGKQKHCIRAYVVNEFDVPRGTVDEVDCFDFQPLAKAKEPEEVKATVDYKRHIAIVDPGIYEYQGATPRYSLQVQAGQLYTSMLLSAQKTGALQALEKGGFAKGVPGRRLARIARTTNVRKRDNTLIFRIPRNAKKVRVRISGVRLPGMKRRPKVLGTTLTRKHRKARFGTKVKHKKHKRKHGHKKKRKR